MIEYPSIIGVSKAPRELCAVFDKIDGSNIRIKWTRKQGFCLFGSRHQLFDETHPFLAPAITYFKTNFEQGLDKYFRSAKEFRDEREIIVFGEMFGPSSFAGVHKVEEPKKLVIIDALIGHRNPYFLRPPDFSRLANIVETPELITITKLNEELIEDVRKNKFGLKEGVVCKGFSTNGAYRGKMWMCKIKTLDYLAKIKALYGDDWEKYWE